MTLGEDGSGFSKAQPDLFFPAAVGNIGEAWPPLRLPLFLRRRLREEEREIWDESLARPGLRIDLEDSFMEEDDERRDVKQMKSSLVAEEVLCVFAAAANDDDEDDDSICLVQRVLDIVVLFMMIMTIKEEER